MAGAPALAAALSAILLAGCSLATLQGGAGIDPTTASIEPACGPGQFALAGRVPPPGDAGAPISALQPGDWAISDNSETCACTLVLSGNGDANARGCRHPGLQAVERYGLTANSGGTELVLLGADESTVMFRLAPDGQNRYSGMLNGRPVVMWLPAL